MEIRPKDIIALHAMTSNYQDTHLGREREPDVVGNRLSMWRVNFQSGDTKGDKGVVIGMWFLYMPNNSPMLPYKVASVLQFSKMSSMPIRVNSKHEYEFMILTLSPEYPVPNLVSLESLSDDAPLIYLASDEADVMLEFEGGKGGNSQVYDTIDTALADLVKGKFNDGGTDWRLAWGHAIFERILSMINQPAPTVN